MLHWLFDVSLVIGTAAMLFDPHSHACASCGAVWRHIGLGRGRSVKAHTCPGCGQMQWERR